MEQTQSVKRPATVVVFEVLGLVTAALPMVLDPVDFLVFNLVTFAFGAAFILWITRWRSWTGRLIYTILVVIGVCLMLAEQFSYPDLFGSLVTLTFAAVLLALAWAPATTRWLNAKDPSA
jgi:hypothetical protein